MPDRDAWSPSYPECPGVGTRGYPSLPAVRYLLRMTIQPPLKSARPAHSSPRTKRRDGSSAPTHRLGHLVAALLLTGCASAPPVPTAPPPDANQVALGATRASELDVPYRLFFEWSVVEPGSRLSGRGVARIEPPYRARLDLFSSNGERIAAAALDGGTLRVAEDRQTEVPPPALFWGTLGVFRPGTGVALMGGRRFPNGDIELRYQQADATELLYRLRANRIERIDLRRGGRAREEVALTRVEGERFPRRATYRHLDDVRELSITLESIEHAESYPTDIWDPAL